MIPLALLATTTSCLDQGDETLAFNRHETPGNPDTPSVKEPADIIGIPDDKNAEEDPISEDKNNNPGTPSTDDNTDIPNAPVVVILSEKYGYIPLSGIADADGNWMMLSGTGKPDQSVWLAIDDEPKAVDAILCSEACRQPHEYAFKAPVDVVFLINSSSSMQDEIDALASGISSWGESIDEDGLNLRVGYVSYDEGDYSINGAADLCADDDINDFLHRPGLTGNQRARGFCGRNAASLESLSKDPEYQSGYNNECDVLAVRFANDHFSFRDSATRMYVDITDEPNQPGGMPKWSVDYFSPDNNFWSPWQGTIHTVFNGPRDFAEVANQIEKPWRMAAYTGGTQEFFDSSFKNATLTDLKFTQTLKMTHLLRFRALPEYFDGKKHKVKITVRTPDGATHAQRVMQMTFSEN